MTTWMAALVLLQAGMVDAKPDTDVPRSPITALGFAPDGDVVLVGSQAGLELRSWPTLAPLRKLPTTLSHVHDLAVAPDGKTLALVGGSPARLGAIELFSWPEGKLLRRAAIAKDLLLAVQWRGDSRGFATACADGVVRLLDADSLKERQRFEGHSRGVLSLAFISRDGQLLTAGLDDTLRVWDVEKGTLTRTLSNHTRPVLGLTVRPSESTLPMVASIGEDRTLRLWQPTIGRLVRFTRLSSTPLAVAWSPDGESLLVSCKDGSLRRIDPDTMELLRETKAIKGPAYSLAVHPGGTVLVGGQHGELKAVE